MLMALRAEGGAGVLRMLASADPAVAPDSVSDITAAVAGFHSWNLLWIGALVAVIAVTLNRRNDRAGYWVNLALAGCTDVGLVVFMLAPGHLRLAEGMVGIVLFVVAAVASSIARRTAQETG